MLRGQTTAETDGIQDRLEGNSALAPTIWSLEGPMRCSQLSVTSVCRWRTPRAFYRLLRELPISVVDARLGQTLGPVLDLARSNGLTRYDACYLDLAMREGVHLATQAPFIRQSTPRILSTGTDAPGR